MAIVDDFASIAGKRNESEKNERDYTSLGECEMLLALGDDGLKWATAFCQMARNIGQPVPSEDWVHVWFANAIEHSNDVRRWRREAETRKAEQEYYDTVADELIAMLEKDDK